jgi:nicotinate-nucleotide adenylyltransferase
MKKIALFGGTFNPVHNGHTHNALFIKNTFGINTVIIIPSKKPVHKNQPYDPGPVHRLTMARIAFSSFDGFEVSSIEIDREKPSYSITTVKDIQLDYPDSRLYFILGTDSFNSLPGWKRYDELIMLVTFIVMRRPGDVPDKSLLKKIPDTRIADNSLLDISSTDLRKKLCEKKDCTGEMDTAVLDYIERKGLY